MNKLAILEGLLFVVGDDGMKIDKLADILEINEKEVQKLLKDLQKKYESDDSGIKISFIGETFKLTTKKEHKEYYQKLINDYKTESLSNASLETLAIVAYNQPISRIEINELRGIDSSHILRKLLARDLIKVSGKSSLPGNPNLYKTTNEFLDYFALASLDDLPELEITLMKDDEKDLFKSIYKEK